jgi:hypothetical protein
MYWVSSRNRPATVEVVLNGQPSIQSNTFHFKGTLSAEAHRTDSSYKFNNISIILYNQDKQIIDRISIGSLTSEPGENTINITITSDSIPAYVVVESKDFWNKSVDVNIKAWRQSDSEFIQYWITSQDDKFAE